MLVYDCNLRAGRLLHAFIRRSCANQTTVACSCRSTCEETKSNRGCDLSLADPTQERDDWTEIGRCSRLLQQTLTGTHTMLLHVSEPDRRLCLDAAVWPRLDGWGYYYMFSRDSQHGSSRMLLGYHRPTRCDGYPSAGLRQRVRRSREGLEKCTELYYRSKKEKTIRRWILVFICVYLHANTSLHVVAMLVQRHMIFARLSQQVVSRAIQ